jgi:hypothetical protein
MVAYGANGFYNIACPASPLVRIWRPLRRCGGGPRQVAGTTHKGMEKKGLVEDGISSSADVRTLAFVDIVYLQASRIAPHEVPIRALAMTGMVTALLDLGNHGRSDIGLRLPGRGYPRGPAPMP